MSIYKISAMSLHRKNEEDEIIIFNPANGQVEIVGRTLSCRVHFSVINLDRAGLSESGILSVNSNNAHISLNLSMSEFNQCENFLKTMKRSFLEVKSC